MRGVRRYVREFAAVAGIFLMSLLVAGYILSNQRLRPPWEDTLEISAEFSSAQAVTPGQGQSVNVAGVKVGEIAKVTLENGRAVVRMDIEPDKLDAVYPNAHMLLRPKTGLADMSVALDPGTPQRGMKDGGELEDGARLPVQNGAPNVNPDAVLAALDGDSRRYLSVFVHAGAGGLKNKGPQLRAILRASQPTLRDTATVSRAIAGRRTQLRRLITNLRRLSKAGADKDRELASLVAATDDTLSTIGSHDRRLESAVVRLPGALGATRDALGSAGRLADEAGPALEALRPTARVLSPALVKVRPLLRDARPILKNQLRPLVREATPLLADLRPSVKNLVPATTDLIPVGKDLNYVANELAYNPPGPEEGYLFWSAWFFHNANSILSIEDAHGVAWRGLAMVGCSTGGQLAGQIPALQPVIEAVKTGCGKPGAGP